MSAFQPDKPVYRRCEGGTAVDVDRERYVARCPGCSYTFSTLMDSPEVPPHYINEMGGTVTFVRDPT